MRTLSIPLACLLVGALSPAGWTAEEAKPATYQTPKDWKSIPPNPFSVARYQVGMGDRMAMVTISRLPGEAGGLVGNVNRWRGQVGLEALPEKAVLQSAKAIKIDGLTGHAVDLTGPNVPDKPTQRILGAIVKRGEDTWFFKMSGPTALVAEQKAGFDGFLKSVRFGK